ncbi:hypothetical protein EXIGLDRAFT_834019 [Exidia glandulosa HHB12029]|uniref:F-box domain-containing protein n=1 Tax=Exidia glandulosa HHB12029 TaxID=1314781 RepID=A0A166AWU3_EXIGL|nr:hypothetical protein EXIGLDRAFT_834019 [Exidia glandulosa HHB12029]
MDISRELGIELSPSIADSLRVVLNTASIGTVDEVVPPDVMFAKHDVERSLEAVLSAIRRRRNRKALINAFPVEVLSTIFRFYAGSLRLEDRSLRNVVLHVCHHWRQVALADCVLWREVHITSSRADEILADLLTRTRSVSLAVDVTLSAVANDGIMICTPPDRCARAGAVIAQHLDRIESLILSFNDTQAHPLLSALTVPAPRLHRLGLYLDVDHSEGQWLDIPRSIFQRVTGPVRRLHLENIRPPDRRHFLLPGLEELCLTGNETALSVPSMDDMFAACPQLKAASFMQLKFDSIEEFSSQKWRCPTLGAVSLDNLETKTTIHLLGHLPLAKIPSLTLHCFSPEPRLRDLLIPLFNLDSFAHPPDFISVRGDFPEDDVRVEVRDGSFARIVAVSVRSDAGAHEPWETLLRVLQDQKLFAGVKHLHISVGMWPGVLRGFTASHTLRVLTLEVAEDTLLQFQPCIPVEGATAFYCPALELLNITSPQPTSLGAYLLLAFLELSIRYGAERLECLTLDNVSVEPGPAFDAALDHVCKVEFVNRM